MTSFHLNRQKKLQLHPNHHPPHSPPHYNSYSTESPITHIQQAYNFSLEEKKFLCTEPFN